LTIADLPAPRFVGALARSIAAATATSAPDRMHNVTRGRFGP
jgi:hypothetical protein